MNAISKKEAVMQGLQFYFTGIPCKRGGIAKRTLNGDCTCNFCSDASKLRKSEWNKNNQIQAANNKSNWAKNNSDKLAASVKKCRHNNPEKYKSVNNDYYAKNKEKRKESQAIYYYKNIELIAVKNKTRRDNDTEKYKNRVAKYQSENPHILANNNAKRRALKLNATVDWNEELTQFVAEEAYDLAKHREQITGFEWHVDHMIPLKAKNVSGLHVWNNLQVIPAKLNESKHNKLILTDIGEWIDKI